MTQTETFLKQLKDICFESPPTPSSPTLSKTSLNCRSTSPHSRNHQQPDSKVILDRILNESKKNSNTDANLKNELKSKELKMKEPKECLVPEGTIKNLKPELSNIKKIKNLNKKRGVEAKPK